jgi:hypothetical protein
MKREFTGPWRRYVLVNAALKALPPTNNFSTVLAACMIFSRVLIFESKSEDGGCRLPQNVS